MKKLPTDLQILNAIYNQGYNQFMAFLKNNPDRSAKNFIPIDIAQIAKRFGVDVDIIFGRLYYHLEQKYGYSRSDGSKVAFFALKIGSDNNCINFPYMASVLAKLRDREKKQSIAKNIAIFSLIIAGLSSIIAVISLLLSSKPG
jgi:hypothetical protein